MSEVAQQLMAGGLVPVGVVVPSDLPTDTVDARIYGHPALDGQRVVRLVPDAIALGVDTEMGLLGFAPTDHRDDIAIQRRRTLGFPGAALVADPARGKFALDVMKEFRKHAKRIPSKPGHARDGFDAVAEGLSRQVPHFLPSFWEEVARSYASAGNVTYAATAFDRARTAEREFGLDVDEERRGEAFLEFALLGALTVKSLQSYGKELQRVVGAELAYERMFALAVRRTLGGLPPWATLPKDLRTLCKAAKKDLRTEDLRFLREVIGGSAVQRAPASFWEAYREAVVALGLEVPAFRARLLDLMPSGGMRRVTDDFRETWMEILAESQALALLWDPAAPVLPSGGRAAWFDRYQSWSTAGNGWILQLVRKAAPILAADGVPLPILGHYYRPLDLDLVDLVVELGLPFTLAVVGRLDLCAWSRWTPAPARHGLAAEHRPRDPAYAVRDPQVLSALRPAVNAAFGESEFEAIASRLTALQELRRNWLDGQLADLTVSGIAATSLALKRLEKDTNASHFAEFPHTTEVLARADVAVALHRTLETGIFDELGWPAFDEVVAELQPKPDRKTLVCRQWPYLIIGDRRKLWVLGPNGVEHTHEPKTGKHEPDVAAWVGGQLFVAWRPQRCVGYWSGAPDDVFDIEHSHGGHELPHYRADAILVSTTWFTVGDRTAIPRYCGQLHERETSWVQLDDGWHVQDRSTGQPKELRPPPFAGDGSVEDVAYYVVPDAIAATTPCPVVDGRYGARRVQTDAGVAFETLPGERHVGGIRHGVGLREPTMLVRWPGASRYRAVAEEASYWRNAHNPSFYVADPDRPVVALFHDEDHGSAHAWLPVGRFWHYLVPRDLAGSAALRTLSPSVAARLLEAGIDGSEDAAEEAVRALIPEIRDDVLRKGVVRAVLDAAALEVRLRELRDERGGGEVAPLATEGLLDSAVSAAVTCLGHYSSGGQVSITEGVRSLGSFLVRDGETGRNVSFTCVRHEEWVGRIRALAWCAVRPGLTDPQRASLVSVLGTWADSGLADDGWFRSGSMRIDGLAPWVTTKRVSGETVPWCAWRHDEVDPSGTVRRMLVWGAKEEASGPWWVRFVEHSSDGTFRDWPDAEITHERRNRTVGDRPWLEAFVAEAGRGPRKVTSEGADALAARTGQSSAEAGYLLATLPPDMDRETRGALALKATDVKVAHQQMARIDIDARLELLASAAPVDPANLWNEDPADPDGPVARLGDAWVARFGRVVAVPAALMTAADRELRRGGSDRLKQIAAGAWPELDADVAWQLSANGKLTDDDNEGMSGEQAVNLGATLGWLVGRAPVGDPLLAHFPAIREKLVARLRNPSLLLSAGWWYDSDASKAFFDALGGELVEVLHNDHGPTGWQRRVGPLVAHRTTWRTALWFRPSELDPTSRELIATFGKASGAGLEELSAWELLQGEDFAALVERTATTPLASGDWEQDPAKSAPAVVAAVAKARGLSDAAAVLYLQTLTLLEPTKKNVCTWNGWAAKTYLAAAAELVDQGLVLEGKRARSGREHFLPGPWVECKDILPYEEWKQPLYGWKDRAPLGTVVPLAPFHRLFERAWARCVADPPGFEELDGRR